MINYTALKEKALINILFLFEFWELEYRKISDVEYDFINPTRDDRNFGACRFNIQKGLGADFTGVNFTNSDFQSFGMGFSKEDFASTVQGKTVTFGFDVIGLVQRLYSCSSYTEAAKLLTKQLSDLSKIVQLQKPTLEAALKRQQEQEEIAKKKLITANRVWKICIPIKDTIGEKYLLSRSIILKEIPNVIRYHPKIMNRELKRPIPAILFKVQSEPNGDLKAIHRIYIKEDGSGKADLECPKMALGAIKDSGIWFGKPGPKLCIVEGPENALSILSLGYEFVVSTIDSANFCNISIPEYVEEILLLPDGDRAGKIAAEKAAHRYKEFCKKIKIVFPPQYKDKPKWDWNDELVSRGNNDKKER